MQTIKFLQQKLVNSSPSLSALTFSAVGLWENNFYKALQETVGCAQTKKMSANMDAKTLRNAVETVLKLIGIPVVEPNIISAISKADDNTESFDMKYLLQLVFRFYDKVCYARFIFRVADTLLFSNLFSREQRIPTVVFNQKNLLTCVVIIALW